MQLKAYADISARPSVRYREKLSEGPRLKKSHADHETRLITSYPLF